MKHSCQEFRQQLGAWLCAPSEGRHAAQHAADGQALAWNAHLLSCTPCRRLLDDERALNELLASVPTPSLNALQRERLLARLQHDVRLEALLALADPAAPQGLADRIWAHVQAEAKVPANPLERQLDRQLAHIDAIEAPSGLAQRVWEHCQTEGEPQRVPLGSGPQSARTRGPQNSAPKGRKLAPRHWWSTGLAAAGLAAFLWFLPGTDAPGDQEARVANHEERAADPSSSNGAPDPELLAMLDTLEIMDMVDELDSEEWELLDEYDPFTVLALEGEWSEVEESNPAGESR